MRKIPKLIKAFTLVEILIVIAIIGILSVTIFPKVNKALETSRDFARINGLKQIASALEFYKDSHGHYPLREPTDKEWAEINAHEKYKYSWGRYYNLE